MIIPHEEKERCGGCVYYCGFGECIGKCRRYPPKQTYDDSVRSHYPTVRVRDWCGEFKRKKNKIKIINIVDKDDILKVFNSEEGKKAIVNIIGRDMAKGGKLR